MIAVDRGIHALVLGVLAVAIFVFATHRSVLHHDYTKILSDLQGGLGGPVIDSRSGVVSDLNHLFTISVTELYVVGLVVVGYTVLLVAEMVGLWRGRRWADYLTLTEVGLLVPFEVYELTRSISYLKMITLAVNLAVVGYLLFAHRLFGVRGGVASQRAEYERDCGWAAVERSTPPID